MKKKYPQTTEWGRNIETFVKCQFRSKFASRSCANYIRKAGTSKLFSFCVVRLSGRFAVRMRWSAHRIEQLKKEQKPKKKQQNNDWQICML